MTTHTSGFNGSSAGADDVDLMGSSSGSNNGCIGGAEDSDVLMYSRTTAGIPIGTVVLLYIAIKLCIFVKIAMASLLIH